MTSPMSAENALVRLAALLDPESVRTDEEARSRAVASWSPLFFKQRRPDGGASLAPLPDAVALPSDTAQVAAIVRWANENRAALVPVGGASNTVGANAVPTGRAGSVVAVDLSRLDTLRWDEESLLAHVGAGVNLGALEERLNAHDYTLGHLPQSLHLATVGGAVATNAVGLLSGRYGRQRDLTAGLEVVLPTGETLHTTPGMDTAFDLHDLLIGSEGAFGIVTEASLRIRPVPNVRAWASFTFPNFADGIDAVRLIYRSDARPATVRLIDPDSARERLYALGTYTPAALLLLAFEGDELVQTGSYQVAYAICQRIGGKDRSPELGETWFEEARTQSGWMSANARPGGIADMLAVFAPWSVIKGVEAAVRKAISPLVRELEVHLGHPSIEGAALDIRFSADANPATPEGAIALYQRIADAGLTAALAAGGSVTHHFGIGQTRRAYFERERGPVAMAALRAIKGALDPNGVLPAI